MKPPRKGPARRVPPAPREPVVLPGRAIRWTDAQLQAETAAGFLQVFTDAAGVAWTKDAPPEARELLNASSMDEGEP